MSQTNPPVIPRVSGLAEVKANGGKLPARSVDAFSVRTVYASTVATPDCNLFTGLTAASGTPTDNHVALNAVLATATANSPVHLILDGGFALGHSMLVPPTGHVAITGQGWSTGLYMLPGSNSNPITNTAGTDLASHQAWNPGIGATANRGSNVTLSNFRIHCNRGTYPTGNCNGVADGTNGAASSPDARGIQTSDWLLTGPMFVGLDNLTIEDLWIYDAPTFHIDLYACTRVKIRGCRIEAADPTVLGNTDGIHVNGGCSEVSITDCWFSTGDDAIALNLEEGNGQPGSDFVIDNITLRNCLNAGRIYGLNNGTTHRVSITNVRGTVQNQGFNIGFEGGGTDASEANRSVYVGNVELAFTNTDAQRNAIVWINSSAAVVEVENCGFVDPTIACPIVKMNTNAPVVSSLRITNPRIHRSPSGSVASWIFEGTHGTVGDLRIVGASVTETVGQAYTDIASLVNLNGTTVGSLTFSGKLKGVGTAVNVTSSSAVGAIDLPDLTHQANTGTNAAHSVVAAGSTVSVGVGRFRGINLSSVASGTVALYGPGVLSSGATFADALMDNNTPYLGSDHSGVPCIKVGGTANVFAFGALGPATAYTLTGPSGGLVNSASANFTVQPNGTYSGTVTITPSGGGLSTPVVKTFSGTSTAQTFTITPTATGTVTLTGTNSGSLTNPSALSYAASSSVGAAHSMLSVHASNTEQGCPLSRANAAAFQAGAGSFSVGCFARFSAGALPTTPTRSLSLLSKADSAIEYVLFYNAGPGKFSWATAAGVSTFEVDGATTPTVGPWYFVVGVWDATAGQINLYVNNALDGGPTTATQPDNGTSAFMIGETNLFANTGFQGDLAMVFKYPFALTTGTGSQMEWLYNAGHGRSSAEILAHTGLTTPDCLYTFDDGASLGTDSGANALTLAASFATAPTQGTGPA